MNPQDLLDRLDKCVQALGRGNAHLKTLGLEKAKTERDIAESAYYTALQAMENLRLEIEILRSKLTWLRAEFKNS